jgi:uncharacterized protein with GYD domain
MSHYLLRWQFSQSTMQSFAEKPQNRTQAAGALIEGFGGKLLSYYFSFGEYDGVAVCEFPDAISVAACSLKASGTGAFTRFETMPLLTAAEAETAMQKVKASKVAYQAPNA